MAQISIDTLPDAVSISITVGSGPAGFGAEPIPGSVMLFNNSFDRVNACLDPDLGPAHWGGTHSAPTVDLRLTATNNTFRGGWLLLEPVRAFAGDWVFENNLFDKVVFAQDTALPLDFDFNAYYPCD